MDIETYTEKESHGGKNKNVVMTNEKNRSTIVILFSKFLRNFQTKGWNVGLYHKVTAQNNTNWVVLKNLVVIPNYQVIYQTTKITKWRKGICVFISTIYIDIVMKPKS